MFGIGRSGAGPAGNLELWGGYASGSGGGSIGGDAIMWGGGQGGGSGEGGDAMIIGGESETQPGDAKVIGGVATTGGQGGAAIIAGGAGFGTNQGGGLARIDGGLGIGTGSGGQANLRGGNSGSGATGTGGAVELLGGLSGATNGDGGAITIQSGLGAGSGDNGVININLGSTGAFLIDDVQGIAAVNGGGPAILNELASATNPTLVPNRSDIDTGIGRNAADQLSLIAGGVEGFTVAESGAVITNTIRGNLVANAAGGPALFNESATFNNPNVLPNKTDDDTGIGYGGSDVLDLIAGASNRVRLTSGDSTFRGDWAANTSTGPSVLDEAASATNPTIVPNKADDDTGLGSAAADQLDLVAGGLSCMAVRETAAARQIGFYTTAPISQQTGVAVSSAGIHAALVALGLITA